MPPEDSPPLAPFPELSSASRRAPDEPTGETPLLSEAQRRELTRVAGSLEGKTVPGLADEAATETPDDFLLTSATNAPAIAAMAPDLPPVDTVGKARAEEPVMEVDFLGLPGTSPGAAGLTDDGFSLQGLAAALTGAAVPPGAPGLPPARDDWDLPSYFSAPDPAPALKPDSVAGAPSPQFPTALAAPAPGAMASVTTSAPAASKPFDLPPPASAGSLFAGLSAASGPEFSGRVAEPGPDFDEPLTFPVPSATGVSAPPLEAIPEPNDRGIGMVLSGALLIMAGMFLACRVPALALEADALAVSSHALADVRVAHLQGEMFFCAAGAAACLLLGIGSATLRRWAPPLIHAAGWVVLLTVLLFMGTATASMFYLSSNETPGDAVPGDGIALFAFAGLLGVALPLGLIALFQRPSVSRLCVLVDNKPRWTDGRTVPGLMVFITGMMLAITAFALSIAHAAIPLFGEIGDGNVSMQVWAGTGLIAAGAAGFAAAGKRAGWWLLLVPSVAASVSLFLTCRQHDWRHLFHLPATGSGSVVGGVLAAAAMLPPILILLMTRRAFLNHGKGSHD